MAIYEKGSILLFALLFCGSASAQSIPLWEKEIFRVTKEFRGAKQREEQRKRTGMATSPAELVLLQSLVARRHDLYFKIGKEVLDQVGKAKDEPLGKQLALVENYLGRANILMELERDLTRHGYQSIPPSQATFLVSYLTAAQGKIQEKMLKIGGP